MNSHVNSPQHRKLSFAELKREASGNWAFIFEDLCSELGPAIEARGHHVACPVHGGSDGFRLFKDYNETGGGICNTCGPHADGFAMLVWVKGYSNRDAVREVAQWLRKEQVEQTASLRPPPPVAIPPDPEKARKTIRSIWTSTQPIRGTPAERYLINRGIFASNVPTTLRFHPSLRFYDIKEKKFYGNFPALVAPIKDEKGEVIALHRIYLTAEGKKAEVPEPKKMTSCVKPPQGSAIRLFHAAGKVLGVGEGIETMLAVHAVTRMPVWSAVSAVLLEHLIVPDYVEHVVIWSDLDRSGRGQQASDVLSKRLIAQGKTVDIQTPPQAIPEGTKGLDWLDVLNNHGFQGYPESYRFRRRPAA